MRGGLNWTHLGYLGLTWSHLDLVSLGLIWTHLVSLGLTQTHLESPLPQGVSENFPPEKRKGKGGHGRFCPLSALPPDRAHARTNERNETTRFPRWSHPPNLRFTITPALDPKRHLLETPQGSLGGCPGIFSWRAHRGQER